MIVRYKILSKELPFLIAILLLLKFTWFAYTPNMGEAQYQHSSLMHLHDYSCQLYIYTYTDNVNEQVEPFSHKLPLQVKILSCSFLEEYKNKVYPFQQYYPKPIICSPTGIFMCLRL